MALHNFLLILFLSVSCWAQQKENAKPVSGLTGDEKLMYSILKECTLKQAKDAKQVYFFPGYNVRNDRDYITLSVYFYDAASLYNTSLSTYTATYLATIRLKKYTEPAKQEGGTGRASYDDSSKDRESKKSFKPTYYLVVSESGEINPKSILEKKSDRPFFKDGNYTEIKFDISSTENKADESLYNMAGLYVNFVNAQYAVVGSKGHFGVIGPKNQTLIPFDYNDIKYTPFGLLAKKDGTYFFIDIKNQQLSDSYSEVKYDFWQAIPLLKGYMKVKKDGKATLIDAKYNVVHPYVYDDLKLIYTTGPLLFIGVRNNKQALISFPSWKEVMFFDKIEKVDEELLFVENEKKFGLLHKDGKAVLDIAYDAIKLESYYTYPTLYFSVKQGNSYALAHTSGLLTPFLYDELLFYNSHIQVKKGNKYGLINYQAKPLTEIKYDAIKYNEKLKQYEGTINSLVERITMSKH